MRNKSHHEKHSFAFFYAETTKLCDDNRIGAHLIVQDRVLCHRIMHVLRLEKGQTFTLFDSDKHMVCELQEINERHVNMLLQSSACNVQYTPPITFLLPLLKKEAFDQALYALAELGASDVKVVMTKKTQRTWGGQKEAERIERILQAAAEQSKNFAFPHVSSPVPLMNAVNDLHPESIKIFFDPDGCHLNTLIHSIYTSLPINIVLLVGPEGDLTADEKCSLNYSGFVFCRLTGTILRAQQAVAVSLGALRSMVRTS